jgi:hypothetical protein
MDEKLGNLLDCDHLGSGETELVSYQDNQQDVDVNGHPPRIVRRRRFSCWRFSFPEIELI